jgi:hypothetical protein
MATVGDLVLIYFEDKPMSFARVEDILPDSKPGWFHIKLLMLQVPLQVVSWILRDAYILGDEFTMNGNRMRLEKVLSPETFDDPAELFPEGGGIGANGVAGASGAAGADDAAGVSDAAGTKADAPASARKSGSAKVISLHDRKRS